MQIEAQWSKNSKFFDHVKLELLKITKKKNRKAKPKIEKIYVLNIYRECLLCLHPNASGRFLQTYINFVEHRLKFCHLEGNKERVRSLVVSDLRSESIGSRLESGCSLCAEVSSLQ